PFRAPRLPGPRVLAPGPLDEPAGLGVIAAEELLEFLEGGDVVTRSLAQTFTRLLDQPGLDAFEDVCDHVDSPIARHGLPRESLVVAPCHRHHPLLDVAPAELD